MNLKVFKNRNFSLLMLGKAVSMMGSNMQQFALSLYVLAVTGSATIFASMMAISILPRLLLSPVAGVFGDWFDRKKSIVILDFINGILIAIYAAYYIVSGELSILSIYILVILLEVTEIFFGSAMAAVVPSIVEKEDLFQANSIKSLVSSGCSILSPLLASVLYGFLGLKIMFIINSISFILSALSELTIDIPATHKKPDKISLKAFNTDLMEGIKIIKDNRMIMNIIGIGMIINFCLSPLFSVGLIYVIRETLQGSEVQYGIFATAVSLAMFISPILLGGIARKIQVGKLTVIIFTLVSALTGLLALVTSNLFIGLYQTNIVPFVAIIVISFLIGLVVTLANIAIGTLFDTIVPRQFMGRTATVLNLGMTVAMPLGQMVFGITLDILPASYIIVSTAVIILLSIMKYRKPLLDTDQTTSKETQTSTVNGDLSL